MINATLRNLADNFYSQSAFIGTDDNERIKGRVGELSLMNGGALLDVWFVDSNYAGALTQRLINVRTEKLLTLIPQAVKLNKLDGEAIARIPVAKMRAQDWETLGDLLQIRKRRQLSEATRERLAQHMKSISQLADEIIEESKND